MRKTLLLLLATTSTSFSLPAPEFLRENSFINKMNRVISEVATLVQGEYEYSKISDKPLDELRDLLRQTGNLSNAVINKVLTSLKCADEYNVEHNNILTIIDYSLPSNKKRLWIFSLKEKKLLFNTYVSHGINSGALLSNSFSNRNNSKASSIGVYETEQIYYGRDGLSLRLNGLDKGFNDNALERYVVMHGGWYVNEDFIKRYGRAGRSWGCPAIPEKLTSSIIHTIKDKSLFVVYYPSDNWFEKSKFLNCKNLALSENQRPVQDPPNVENKLEEEIFFVDLNKNNKREENEPIVVIAADNYKRIFNRTAPLERMLRRQINDIEYIALTQWEFEGISKINNQNNHALATVHFVVPVVKMQRGYYATEMQLVSLGRIKEVRLNNDSSDAAMQTKSYTVLFEEKPFVNLRSTSRFIRWLGL